MIGGGEGEVKCTKIVLHHNVGREPIETERPCTAAEAQTETARVQKTAEEMRAAQRTLKGIELGHDSIKR